VFDRCTAWRSHFTLPVPHGTQALTCVWVRNNLLTSARPIYNVRMRIEYFHDGSSEFVIQSALWLYDRPRKATDWRERIVLDANETQCVPVFMQPVGAKNLDPLYPQSALDDQRSTRGLLPGRWKLRITITADAVEPIIGEFEFTVYQQQGEERLSIGCHPPMVATRLPAVNVIPKEKTTGFLSDLWHVIGRHWKLDASLAIGLGRSDSVSTSRHYCSWPRLVLPQSTG
jgi:hypothetical protein